MFLWVFKCQSKSSALNVTVDIVLSLLFCSRMLRYLQDAKESLDVCIYLLTVRDISNQIVKAHNRGLKVRVITDEDMANGSGSQINSFRQAGKLIL